MQFSALLLFFAAFFIGLGAGIFGVIYRHILAYEPGFTKWWQFGNKFEKRWFFRPVWACEKCIAGQVAGWTFLLSFLVPQLIYGGYTRNPAVWVFATFFAITMAIFTALFLTSPVIDAREKLKS